jgi:hypothetical protein
MQQIVLGGLVEIEKANILLVPRRYGVLYKNHQESILVFVLSVRYARTRLELPFFHKGIGRAFAQKTSVGLNQCIIQHELIQIVTQQLIVGST